MPVYSESNRILADENFVLRFEINQKDLELTKNYLNYIGDKVALAKFDIQPKILNKINDSFNNENDFYKTDSGIDAIGRPDIITKNLIKHFSIKSKEFKDFKPLENEIIHFKQIKISERQKEKIEQKIKQVLSYKEKDKKLAEVVEKIQKEPQKALEYTKEI